jgi:acetylornithine deacetylase/succinyl-diaminopimelate desuccinylase-like protein
MSRVAGAAAYVDDRWRADIVPILRDYVAIPNVSPAFDAEWASRGHIRDAVDLVAGWCRSRPIDGLRVEVHELPGRTPLLLCDVPAFGAAGGDDTVVLYGHLDKQPAMEGWRDGLGPWTPVLDGDRLYGRGGADDGYAAFASLVAIEAVREAGGSHHRCVVLVEASEESGSPDLPAYVEALAHRVGTPSLVLCLDSGALDYDRLWVTTSLRGLANGTLRVEILDEGVHSGSATGIVPDSFRIAREVLSRIEDSRTGEVAVAACRAEVPDDRRREAEETAAVIAAPPSAEFPFVAGSRPTSADTVTQLLQRTWAPGLAVIGAEGLPPMARAGNVLRPATALGLSMRLPPTCDAGAAVDAIGAALTADPPYGARVAFEGREASPGWNAPSFAPWLWSAVDEASRDSFGAPAAAYGAGGSIPFMGMLGARFPSAQFVITGVLGPQSNAHGPNEFLDLPTARRLTVVLAAVLDAHAHRPA